MNRWNRSSAAGQATYRARLRRLLMERYEPRALLAVDFEPLKVINPTTGSSSPDSFRQLGSNLIFRALSEVGFELWKTDGTAAGTTLLKDLAPGPFDGNPTNLTVVGSNIFFVANTPTNGRELWKTDGTEAGTVLVKDIQPGAGSSSPTSFVNVNGTLFFSATDGTNGDELWKSDGTAGGTVLVKDINPGAGASNIFSTANLSGVLLFSASDGTSGLELWRSDGTNGGTTRVLDINSGPGNSNPRSFSQVGSVMFFSAADATNGIELWKTGGTSASTSLVRDINPGTTSSYPNYMTNVNGVAYFQARSSLGNELWKSDGTLAGTVLVKDLRPGVYGSYPVALTNLGGTLYFSASDATSGREFWKSDGTSGGTFMIQNLNGTAQGSNPADYTLFGGSIYFMADGSGGRALWRFDGTTASVIKQPTLGTYAAGLAATSGALYFAGGELGAGVELMKSDGTALGTNLLKDINTKLIGSNVSYLGQSDSKAFFQATSNGPGSALWVTDGTEAGTEPVKDINPNSPFMSVQSQAMVNGTLFLAVSDGTSGYELWRSDGTAHGTVRVKDIRPGSASSYPRSLTNVNGLLYFTANDGTSGTELWRSDGTEGGTFQVRDIRAGAYGSSPDGLVNANGLLMFRANDGPTGNELWRSDGTSVGTTMIKNISAAGSSYPVGMTYIGGKVYFQASDGLAGNELWVTDGTALGTTQLADIQAGPSSSSPSDFTFFANKVYFTATDGNGRELWTTDGTSLGTALFKDVLPGSSSSSPSSLLNINNTLYFTAYSTTTSHELWKSDGTVSGTVQVTSLNPSGSSYVYTLNNIAGNLVFIGYNGSFTRSYVSNGTAAGTVPLLTNASQPLQAPLAGVTYLALNNKIYAVVGDFQRIRSNVEIDLTTSSSDRAIVVRKTALGMEVIDQSNSSQLAFISNLAMASVQSLTINGSNAFNDAVTLDYVSGGFFSFPDGIRINGGSSPADTLTINGTNAQRLQWETQASASSANFKVLQQSSSSAGSISNVETITTSGFLSATGVNLLQAGPPNLFFNNPGTLLLAPTTQLGGGTLSTTSSASLAPGSVLTGSGTMSGRFSGDVGSVIMPSGTMSIGLNTSGSGFLTRGDLVVDTNSVSLLDANEAVLGSQTTLGNGPATGSLTASNGLLVDFGNNVTGHGTINTPNLVSKPFTMNGSIVGSSAANPITLTGYIKGVGTLTNVSIAGTYSPGFSPAAVTVGSLSYASTSTTLIEIGGTTPGTAHDQINHVGSAALAGTLNVQLINSYTPIVGDSFTIMTATAGFTGSFTTRILPTPPLGSGWNLVTGTNSIVLQLVDLANVASTQFGDGTPQHSRIDKLVVTFQGAVDLDVGAFGLLKRGVGGGSVATSFTTSTNGSGDTVATVTFSGAFTRAGGALLDGYYQLTIDNTKVRRAGTQLALDGDSNGLAGGDFVRGTSATDAFFAYFGDTSGDGLVGIAEFGQFRSTFGKLPSDAGYNALFDYDGSGVGVADFGQFRSRFGQGIVFQ